jgi:hypothetical protein
MVRNHVIYSGWFGGGAIIFKLLHFQISKSIKIFDILGIQMLE